MSGETNLDKLIASMQPVLHADTFVFATITYSIPPDCHPLMVFQEAEGMTLIVSKREAVALEIDYQFPCRMITLNIHSALDAVGFLARVTTRLAALNMGVNPVSGFYHDHLFVPEDRADDAMAELKKMSLELA